MKLDVFKGGRRVLYAAMAVAALFVAHNASAESVLLKCDLAGQKTYLLDAVSVEPFRESVQVEVGRIKQHLLIDIQGVELQTAISSRTFRSESGRDFRGQDLSTEHRWEVFTEVSGGGNESEQQVSIDRRTGLMVFESTFRKDGRSLRTLVSGSCERIEAARNKL